MCLANKELELVQMRSEGNAPLYRLDAETLHQTSQGLLSLESMANLILMEQMEEIVGEK